MLDPIARPPSNGSWLTLHPSAPFRFNPEKDLLAGGAATTGDWWRGRPPKNYFFSFPYQNDETPLFYLRKLRVPLALRGSQNPKVEGPLARCPSFPVRKSRRSSDTSQLPRKKFTTPSDPIVDQTTSPTPDDAGALIFQNLRRGSGRVGENTKRHYFFIYKPAVNFLFTALGYILIHGLS